ncbi:MlaD family protein [Gordonia soli]|uniref:Mce family protein n=1 Tax=Gordonia soli NBRC 108243 TaxID=1223545 RepID=M0QMW8_9ACTN|nr:MCE family protein [Gordonia soli]GAC70005.1 Mce family protein [Gordonia soli NBRC 108243]
MQIATDGRNPSLLQYVLRGLIFLLVLVIVFVLLLMRYQGTFTSTVPVRAQLTDVGDGLTDGADVRYNGLIVGTVSAVSLGDATGGGTQQLKNVDIDLEPKQASGIPSDVTARTVPANLFGVNAVELVRPADPGTSRLSSGDTILADRSRETIKLQDAQNELHALLKAVPPEDLAAVLGTLSDALKGGGAVFGNFVPILDNYWKSINAQFPPGAPSGFENFDRSIRGLSQSAPQLLDALGRSVVPAMTIAEKQRDLTALLTATGGFLDETQALFAQNPNGGKNVVRDLNTMLGALVLEPQSLPQSITALNNLAARVLTVFTGVNGHVQLNLGIGFGAFQRYTRQNCPVYNGGPYGQSRGPGCVGPGTGTGPTSSGPLQVYPELNRKVASAFGQVTTKTDNKTLGAALRRQPNAAETLMLGPLVQSVTPRKPSASQKPSAQKPSAQKPSPQQPKPSGAASGEQRGGR